MGRGRWAVSQKPNWSGRVTLLAESTFLHINILAHPFGSTWSRWDNQSMCEYCFRQSEHAWALLAQALKGSTFFSYKMFAKVDSAERVTLFPRKTCFWYNWELAFYRFFLDRKKVGNFIAGTDTSQSQSTDQQSKQGKHTPLPVDPYYYPGLRFAFHFVTVDVTTVGQSKY